MVKANLIHDNATQTFALPKGLFSATFPAAFYPMNRLKHKYEIMGESGMSFKFESAKNSSS